MFIEYKFFLMYNLMGLVVCQTLPSLWMLNPNTPHLQSIQAHTGPVRCSLRHMQRASVNAEHVWTSSARWLHLHLQCCWPQDLRKLQVSDRPREDELFSVTHTMYCGAQKASKIRSPQCRAEQDSHSHHLTSKAKSV